ncbi:MAG TPA: outer membrane beta-barrel family protein, partial [Flavisolibacter sp.]
AGAKVMITRTRNSLQVEGATGGAWQQDTGRTNFFNYNEGISAAYTSLAGGWKKISVQAGLRAEYTSVLGQSRDLKGEGLNKPDSTYLNLFPSLFLQYRPAPKHTLGLTANRRIDRPAYQDQNPFIYALDALNSEQGNPYLMPQFTNAVELAYTYNNATSLKISYAKTTGYIGQLTYANGITTVMIPQNAGTRQMVGISVSAPVPVSKVLSTYFSLTPYYHYYEILLSGFGGLELQEGGSWGFNGYMSNTIQFKKGWKGSVSGWFNFQNRATIYTARPLGSLDLGAQKNFLGDKATLKLSIVDLLNTQSWKQEAVTNSLQLTTYRKWESRNITVGCSWRFGNTTIKKAREREGGNDGARIREK